MCAEEKQNTQKSFLHNLFTKKKHHHPRSNSGSKSENNATRGRGRGCRENLSKNIFLDIKFIIKFSVYVFPSIPLPFTHFFFQFQLSTFAVLVYSIPLANESIKMQ